MKALILNSGLGHRMGMITKEHPKCMTEISYNDTILKRQLNQLVSFGVSDVVITTGYYDKVLIDYCNALHLPLKIEFVNNPVYASTNYIYSIYCAKELLKNEDIILMHGDLVFENLVLEALLNSPESCMAVSSSAPLPEKDFKAVLTPATQTVSAEVTHTQSAPASALSQLVADPTSDSHSNRAEANSSAPAEPSVAPSLTRISKIGIEYFQNAVAAQPLYKLYKKDWNIWLSAICHYCENGQTQCYAEKAFGEVSDHCKIVPVDIADLLCSEIDTPEDLARVTARLREVNERTVYMCFSTEYIHSGHISIIQKAQRLGRLIIGVLSDEAVANFKRYPLIPYSERKALFETIAGVEKVIEQKTLSYASNLRTLKPNYVVHGDDWCTGFQKAIRTEVENILAEYGGKLVEYPYTNNPKFKEIDAAHRSELSTPDVRRGRLKKLINIKGLVTALEAHSGITGLICENTKVLQDGKTYQFDAMWISSLCDSTAKGKPDIELVDMTSRFRTIDDIMEVTTKPIIFDGDTGGLCEHFVYTVRSLERMGVSMVIIEDKTGLKKNSLFGTEVKQTQDSIENFCAKIAAGKRAQKTKEFMICARIESLILEVGMEDALARAFAYVQAGADAIMIHSRKKDPAEIFEFVRRFRAKDSQTPIVVVPTSFNTVTEQEFKDAGVNVVIYANQLTRTGFPAMQNAAYTILQNHRAKECDEMCMPIKEIINLIPEE